MLFFVHNNFNPQFKSCIKTPVDNLVTILKNFEGIFFDNGSFLSFFHPDANHSLFQFQISILISMDHLVSQHQGL